MSKKLIFRELQNEPLTYDELSSIVKDDNLMDELEALEDEGLIVKLKKTGKYKVSTKKKNVVINDYILSEESVLDILKESSSSLYNISNKCGAKLEKTKQFVEDMVARGVIAKSQGEYGIIYGIPYEAEVKVNNNGDGVIIINDNKYYIESLARYNVFSGDVISVLYENSYSEYNAYLLKVINHRYDYCVGVINHKKKKTKNGIEDRYSFKSTMLTMPINIPLNSDDVYNIPEDSLVRVKVTYYDYIISISDFEVVGNINDPTVEITKIALEYGFDIEFDDEVREEVKTIPQTILKNEYNGRRDFRDLDIITIDGDDSKDFDDAIYLKILDNGNYQLQVHIADVSHYVNWGSPLDKEALKRGTSLYLADRVIPMLPVQ